MLLPQQEVRPPHGVLLRFVERQDPRGTTSDLMRENSLSSVDKEERGLASWLGHGRADRSHHELELIVPAPAAGLQLLLEGPGLEAPQDLCVGSLGLTVAAQVRHRSVAYLHSKVSTVCFEEVTGELRTIVDDDAVRHPEPAHDALDKLDRGTCGDGADASTNAHLVNLSMAT